MPSPKQPVIYVEDNQKLQTLCQSWATQHLLALDTEFIRTNTFYPLPALVQLNDGEKNYLIDPLKVTEFGPLAEILTNPNVRKVLHACSEDLEVFHRLFGVLPVNLLDTQIAAAFTGLGFSLGYSNLVEQKMGVAIPKDETRSDWLQRPLTDAQCEYAAMDVEYLFDIAQALLSELEQLGRMAWVTEECENLLTSYLESQQEDLAFQRFRGAWRLQPRQLALLKIVASWRETQARKSNKPRNHVVKDKAIYQIAETMPAHVGQLRKISELSDKAIRRYGDTLVELVAFANQISEQDLPQKLPRNPTSQQQAMIKTLRAGISTLAENANLAPELIARKKDYEHIVRAAAKGESGAALLPVSKTSWRAQYLLPVLENAVWNI